MDAVQFAPHGPLDVRFLDCDFLVCSGYKIYGPHMGFMWGRKELLDSLPTFREYFVKDEAPDKYEVGTYSYEAVAGMNAAIGYVEEVGRRCRQLPLPPEEDIGRRGGMRRGMQSMRHYERTITGYALDRFADSPPDVFNHNLETVPRLYRQARPGADYQWSLDLLKQFKAQHPAVPTKSGVMLGLGEARAEVEQVMQDLRDHHCEMLTLGQYLQPTRDHLPVDRFVTPGEFDELRVLGERMGFSNVASGPMVRSSYHADLQANPVLGG